ncbi:winged helix-turn-helix transcriptional regulator [Micromonospora echinaurantiaca]|uniref:winged helix-turn-helix transcriptional regulator n=1 Tax=Micromonospora echinaurantiaca TaxID=47857 RepID=UPI0037BBF83C
MKKRAYSCGLDAAVDVVGGKWKALILWELHHGPRRFAEVRRGVSGISEKMLIQQLREMEAYGLVHREVYRQVPPKVEYSLTAFGASLNEALIPLGEWGERHMATIEAIPRDQPSEKRSEAAGPVG